MRGGIIVSVVIERNPRRFHFNVDLTDSTPKYNCTTKNTTVHQETEVSILEEKLRNRNVNIFQAGMLWISWKADKRNFIKLFPCLLANISADSSEFMMKIVVAVMMIMTIVIVVMIMR